MEKKFLPRRSGKTTKLIKECFANEGQIVCCDLRSSQALLVRSRELGLKIRTPITFDEYFKKIIYNKQNGILPKTLDPIPIYIDDIDSCLESFDPNIQTITLSDDKLVAKAGLFMSEIIFGISNGIYYKRLEKHYPVPEIGYLFLVVYSNGKGEQKESFKTIEVSLDKYKSINIEF